MMNNNEKDCIKYIKPLSVMLDILETMQEVMPKSFMQLIKVKELPLKKIIEVILFKSQQLILAVLSNSSSSIGEDIDEDEVSTPLPTVF